MIWVQFALTALVIVLAATRLATYGDVIALRTGLGRLFVGTLLVAMATSLPELLTAFNAINQGVPNLTAGDFFGSGMFNMLLLAVIDLLNRQKRVLRMVATIHALSTDSMCAVCNFAAYSSTCAPTSTTRSAGSRKKSVALRALRLMKAKRFSRQIAIPGSFDAKTRSRPRK